MTVHGVTVGMAVDWNGFLEVGVPLWIAAFGSAIAAVVSSLNRRNSRTSNGTNLGEMVERTHALAVANAAAIAEIKAATQEA